MCIRDRIINYGAYNLVYATGRAVYRNPDLAVHQSPNQTHFIICLLYTSRCV